MKRHEIIFGVIKVPFDFIIIFISFFIARQLRLITDLIPSINLPIQTIETNSLINFALIGAILYIFIFAIHGLYFIKITSSKIKEFLNIVRYSIYWLIFFLVGIFLGKGFLYETEIPRLIVLFTFIIGTILIIFERIILNNIEYILLKKGILAKKKLLLITNKKNINHILKDIKTSKVYKIIGYSNKKDIQISSIRYIGKIDKIQSLFEKKKCDEILFIDSDYSKKELFTLWELTRIFGIRYRYITNYFDITKSNTTLSLINNIPVIEIKNTPLDNWGKILKRIFDFFSGIIGLILLFPIFIIVGLLIKIEDPKGPIIYKNKRIGQYGKEFTLYKFRYMKWKYCIKEAYNKNNKNDIALEYEKNLIKKASTRNGPLYKIKNDPRKTKIGNFIEKYSIDEIPQFFNLIIGNMSLVGPRPHQAREVDKYSLEQKRLLTIKPGITGMAQVNGRETNDFKKESELDIFYIENWNMLLDLKIILKTFSVIFKRK